MYPANLVSHILFLLLAAAWIVVISYHCHLSISVRH